MIPGLGFLDEPGGERVWSGRKGDTLFGLDSCRVATLEAKALKSSSEVGNAMQRGIDGPACVNRRVIMAGSLACNSVVPTASICTAQPFLTRFLPPSPPPPLPFQLIRLSA